MYTSEVVLKTAQKTGESGVISRNHWKIKGIIQGEIWGIVSPHYCRATCKKAIGFVVIFYMIHDSVWCCFVLQACVFSITKIQVELPGIDIN